MATGRQVQPAPGNEWGPLPPHAAAPRRPAWARWLERALLVVAIVSLGYYGYVSAETLLYQAYEDRELDAILSSRQQQPTKLHDAKRRPGAVRPEAGSAIGRIEIPRLGVSAIIRAGSDARTLRLAVGHIPGTALPGDAGNVGLAGHRDTFFRRLRDIESDDEIVVSTPTDVYRYRVQRTDIVQPQDVWVLDPTETSSLTLVTCYPFSYVGDAPQRFIVRAEQQTP
jgi:sortase A